MSTSSAPRSPCRRSATDTSAPPSPAPTCPPSPSKCFPPRTCPGSSESESSSAAGAASVNGSKAARSTATSVSARRLTTRRSVRRTAFMGSPAEVVSKCPIGDLVANDESRYALTLGASASCAGAEASGIVLSGTSGHSVGRLNPQNGSRTVGASSDSQKSASRMRVTGSGSVAA